jgi:hypothetical protein
MKALHVDESRTFIKTLALIFLLTYGDPSILSAIAKLIGGL